MLCCLMYRGDGLWFKLCGCLFNAYVIEELGLSVVCVFGLWA